MDLYTVLYLKWITNKDLVCSTENSAECGSWMGEEFGGEWIHVYVWLNCSTLHLKLSTLCIGYFVVQSIGCI